MLLIGKQPIAKCVNACQFVKWVELYSLKEMKIIMCFSYACMYVVSDSCVITTTVLSSIAKKMCTGF